MEDFVTLTQAAANRMKELLQGRGTPEAFVRIGTKSGGCNGLKYRLEFADKMEEGDELVEAHGVKILLDSKTLLFIIGTEIDFQEKDLGKGFVFNNPNKKSECGCGESFGV